MALPISFSPSALSNGYIARTDRGYYGVDLDPTNGQYFATLNGNDLSALRVYHAEASDAFQQASDHYDQS